MSGNLLQRASVAEPLALQVPSARALQPLFASNWDQLRERQVKRGWVRTQDFCDIFKICTGNVVHAASRVNKNLKARGFELESWKSGASGPPNKIARITALRSTYQMYRD